MTQPDSISTYRQTPQIPQPVKPKKSIGKRIRKATLYTIGGIVVFAVGNSAGHSSAATTTAASAPIAPQTITQTVTAPPTTITITSSVQLPPPAPVTSTVTQTVTKTVEAAPPAPPAPSATIPGDGTFVIGQDVQPGTYHTTGPDGTGLPCYWARLSNTSGSGDNIIANNLGNGPDTVTISKSDAAFETRGCAAWTKK